MTDRQYLIYACQVLGLDLIKPTKGSKDILIYKEIGGKYECIVESMTWADARVKLSKFIVRE